MQLVRGFSLPDMMVAMAMSSILFVSGSKLLPALQQSVLIQLQQMMIQDDLWLLAFTIGKHCSARDTVQEHALSSI